MKRQIASALALALLMLAAGALALTGNCVGGNGDAERGSGSDADDGGGGETDDAGDDNGDDTGDDDTGTPVTTVLVIHDALDASEAEALAGFLGDLGYSVSRLQDLDIDAGGVAGYDIIVLTGQTTWDNLTKANLVMNTGARIFGFFWGGARFYDVFNLALGFYGLYGGTTFDSETDARVVDASDTIWNVPNPIDIPASGLVTIFSSALNQSCHAANLTPMPADVQPFAYVPTEYGAYVSVGLEKSLYFYWGYDTAIENLTDAGRSLLANAMAVLAE